MAKALKCEYEIDIPEFSKVSSEARDLVQKLLLADPDERLTADQCLSHPWLSGIEKHLNRVKLKAESLKVKNRTIDFSKTNTDFEQK